MVQHPVAVNRGSTSRRIGIRRKLLSWYRLNARDLPWRRTRDPYAIWVSEVMLQQTRVEAVLRYYDRFMARFPDAAALMAADLQEVLKLWEGLGYYRRARHLHQAAREAATKCGGMPRTYDAFHSLPGVGTYTAAAVWAIAFGEPRFPVDGNIRRVISRLYDLDTLREADLREAGEPLLRGLSKRQIPDFVQSLMELGALICLPRDPRCRDCPVTRHCLAKRRGTLADRPPRRERPKVPHHEVVIAYLRDTRGRVLLTQRSQDGFLGGLWELPGGKMEEGESREAALRRELQEELGLSKVTIESYVGAVRHVYTHFSVRLHLFKARTRQEFGTLNGPSDARWVQADQLVNLPVPRGTRNALALLG